MSPSQPAGEATSKTPGTKAPRGSVAYRAWRLSLDEWLDSLDEWLEGDVEVNRALKEKLK